MSRLVKYIIKYDREGCIGAAVCEAFAPDDWVIVKDGKADLTNAKEDTEAGEGQWVKEIGEEAFEANKQAAEGCPAQVIKLYKKNDDSSLGEQVV